MTLRDTIRRGARGVKGLTWQQSDWVSTDAPGNVYSSWYSGGYDHSPDSHINWAALAGNLWHIPAAQACMSAIWKNFPQMPPLVQMRDAGMQWKPAPNQEPADLLRYGNAEQTGVEVMQGLLLSLMFGGDGYLLPELDSTGYPRELKWLPHTRTRPFTAPGSRNLIDEYLYTPQGQYGEPIHIPADRLIHIRFGLDPEDQRHGLAPMRAAARPGVQLDRAATYGANILGNFGTVGALITPAAISGPDGQVVYQSFDPELVTSLYRDKTKGDKVGEVVAFNIPLNAQWPKVTPDDMALTELADRPEADISALMGVPPQVAGLHVGRLSKTYANVAEAREAFWEETLVPLGNMIAEGVNRQLLPMMRVDTKRNRVIFDISEVRPLQPDKDAASVRTVNQYKAGIIDRATAKAELGFVVDEAADTGVYFAPVPNAGAPAELAPADVAALGGLKSLREDWEKPGRWLSRIPLELAALEQYDALVGDGVTPNGNGNHAHAG